eukprot:5385488-Prymnesium_polylepis.1
MTPTLPSCTRSGRSSRRCLSTHTETATTARGCCSRVHSPHPSRCTNRASTASAASGSGRCSCRFILPRS